MTTFGATSPDERDLIRSLHEGSAAALAEIYERTAPALYSLALRIVGARERAACVLEDLYEEIWRDRARWRAASPIPLVAWIARCRELALAQVGPEPSASHAPGFSETSATCGAAWPALAALPERDRRALEEAYFHGRPAREIAAIIGAPTTDAGIILRSALARFRDYADEGADERADDRADDVEAYVAHAGSAS